MRVRDLLQTPSEVKLTEAPIEVGHTGDWEPTTVGGKRTYGQNYQMRNAKDRVLVKHPEFVRRIEDAFSALPIKINANFINEKDPKWGEYHEYAGPVDAAQLGLADWVQPDALNVIFNGNFAGTPDALTPHMIAHRVGHALFDRDAERKTLYKLVNKFVEDIRIAYRIASDNEEVDAEPSYSMFLTTLKYIGPTRSARSGKVQGEYEWAMEMVAYYLTHGGQMKFNEKKLPLHIVAMGLGYIWSPSELGMNMNTFLDNYEAEFNSAIDTAVKKAVGHTFMV